MPIPLLRGLAALGLLFLLAGAAITNVVALDTNPVSPLTYGAIAGVILGNAEGRAAVEGEILSANESCGYQRCNPMAAIGSSRRSNSSSALRRASRGVARDHPDFGHLTHCRACSRAASTWDPD